MKKKCERCGIERLAKRFPKNSNTCVNCQFYGGMFVGRKVLQPKEREQLREKQLELQRVLASNDVPSMLA